MFSFSFQDIFAFFFFSGLALQQLGKNREAKSEFERLLQIDPNHKRAKERLAVIHATLEKDGNHTTEAGESRATSTPTRSKKKSKKAKQKNTNKEKKTDLVTHNNHTLFFSLYELTRF